jgi:hypothetical protein
MFQIRHFASACRSSIIGVDKLFALTGGHSHQLYIAFSLKSLVHNVSSEFGKLDFIAFTKAFS